MAKDALETVVAYHEATKHYPNRYAPGPGQMDWATQPDPFRRFAGASTIELPLTPVSPEPLYDDLYELGRVRCHSMTRETIAAFLQYALGLSAWKEYQGSRWALRMNPSSGNLHPTEGYVILPSVEGFSDAAGVYHYAPKDHLLELRRTLAANDWDALTRDVPGGSFFVALTSIHWREAWKYGERAFRYCQHDVGHAVAALSLSAGVLGWSMLPLPDVGDRGLAALLGLDRVADFDDAEEEHADLLAVVTPSGLASNVSPVGGKDAEVDRAADLDGAGSLDDAGEGSGAGAGHPFIDTDAFSKLSDGPWHGRANRLSPSRRDWLMIEEVTCACDKPTGSMLFRAATVRERSEGRGIKRGSDEGTKRLSDEGRGVESSHHYSASSAEAKSDPPEADRLRDEETERDAAANETPLPSGGAGGGPEREAEQKHELPPGVPGGSSEGFPPPSVEGGPRGVLRERHDKLSAHGIIAQRRSAVDMDGETKITADQFYLMLDRTLPRFDRAPWQALGPPAFVHLALFVHLVDGLEPGLYVLLRRPGCEKAFRSLFHQEFDWHRPDGCPEHVPLYRLLSGDARRVAGQISCGQQIAAGGAFAVGMLAEFDAPLHEHGPWLYRRLFWETGVIGQVLYLEAEAAGVRATGIGCFFDDAMHELLGLEGRTLQSLYHFTTGGAVEDERLRTLEAYALAT